MRIDAQPADELLLDAAVSGFDAMRRPQRHSAQCPLEMLDGRHRHGVNHLLMELRIGFGWRQAILCQQARIFKVNGQIELAACGVDIDDLDVLADRAFLQGLPSHLDDDLSDTRHVILTGESRIEGKNPEPP